MGKPRTGGTPRRSRGRVPGWDDLLERTPAVLVAAAVAVLFVAVYELRTVDRAVDDDILLLLVLPIVLAALRFGAAGGAFAASVALALVFAWDLTRSDINLGISAYVAHAAAFFATGVLLGRFVRSRSSLLERITRAEQISLDMFAVAGGDGYFKSVNPAWERTLGYRRDELLARPFIEFVHPEDHGRTADEAAALSSGRETVSFRNRYRAADGSYRWIEWNAARGQDSLIYAVARDVTVQHQADALVRLEAAELERRVRERTAAVEEARLENLTRLALAAEYRDDETHEHTTRVGNLAGLIARELGLDEHLIWVIRLAAPLHDIGKIGIPDHILLKPGRLTEHEFEVMKTHTTIGAAILGGSNSELLQTGEEIALSHHERWDGSGYPNGVSGERIPLTGRIVAVADAFDAMTNHRPYRRATSTEVARSEVARWSGTHFDPRIVEVFLGAIAGGNIAGAA